MPGETHTYTSAPVPLTLNQMKAIDTGSPIFITVEDYSYGVDELFYQDAMNSGVTFEVDSGDGILRQYVLPTWGPEMIQDVAQRFFPSTVDSNSNLLSLSVPDYSTSTPTWSVHALADNAWWNLYLNNLGNGSTPFNATPSVADSTVLIRMNQDTDRDGYSDRTELALGTNANDAASHPTPELIAAAHSSPPVNGVVTTTLAFLNTGNYDAYGIEAVIYAPDGTTTINDNTIGGSGRVSAGSQVVLGSRILQPGLTNWHGGAIPYSTGSYTGSTDKVFIFTAANPGNISNGTADINWSDGVGNTGVAHFGAGYQAPLPVTIRDGLQIGFNTGTINTGDVFTVTAQLPRDTFSFTDNTGNGTFTKPVVVVSYNDPQGNHKFVTPVQVSDLGTDLTPYGSQMLQGVGVDIAATAPFNASGNNTVYLVANSPDSNSIEGGHLFSEFVDDGGNVVSEQVITDTFQTGPNVRSVSFSGSAFPNFQSGHDYTLLAFFTDAQGNIIDSHARLFSTFAADPAPVLNTSPASWNFGTVTQGAQSQQDISIVNTGLLPLNVVVSPSDPKIALTDKNGNPANGIISVAPAGTSDVIAKLDTTNLSGAVNLSLTVRSNDPAHQTATVNVTGTVNSASGAANAFDIANDPWDKTVRVYNSSGTPLPQNTTVNFTENIQPDTASIEPCKIYDSTGATLKGVGRACTDFGSGVVSAQMFGDGADGPLPVTANPTIVNFYAAIASTANANATTINLASNPGSTLKSNEVLIHQSQGGLVTGTWETDTIASLVGTTLTLQRPLVNTYTEGGNSNAQVVFVPHYTDVTVQSGAVLTAQAWNGTTGGILAFRASGPVLVLSGGMINLNGNGYRGAYPVGWGYLGDQNTRGLQGEGDLNAGEGGGDYANYGNYQTSSRNGSAGGGGDGAANGYGGGGGGNGTYGANGPDAQGGYSTGTPDLTSALFGGGGGSGGTGNTGQHNGHSGFGGNGGGIIFISAVGVTLGGTISANGNQGGNSNNTAAGGGGGGAGGSILLRVQSATLGNSFLTATGSASGGSIQGGSGGDGRVRIEYCGKPPTGPTVPSTTPVKFTCYIAQKTDSSTVQFTVPDRVTSPGQNYLMQFGRRYSFAINGGSVVTATQIIAQSYMTATVDALVTNLGASGVTSLNVSLGGQSILSSTQTITQPITINIPNFASVLNSYLNGQTIGITVSVPISVAVNNQSDVILTNLALTPGSGIDLAVGPGDLSLVCAGGVSCLTNQPSEGDVITPTVKIHNNGNQPASSAVVGYYAGDPNNGGRLLGNSYVATISPGTIVTATLAWNTTGYTHTQTVYAFVDPSNSISENIETNNIISQTLNIKTKPDLRVASIAFDYTDRVVGEPINVTATISNTGETNASTDTQRINGLGERGDSFSQDVLASAIGAASTITASAVFTPTLFGTHTITVTADISNSVVESVETNNVLTSTVYVGLNPPDIDAGGSGDTAYSAANGYGYLNGTTYDFSGTGVLTKTVRYDGNGDIEYRFDGLQPTRAYHFDATFYEEGDTFTQTIKFNGTDSGAVVPLNDSAASTTSILVPPASYATGTMVVDIIRSNVGGAAPTRFKMAGSSTGPAFVSELRLTPIQYAYVDAGSAADLAYDPTRGYGYTGNNTFASTLGGSDAVSTYRSAFTGNVLYEFSGLDPSKQYLADLTLYDGASSTRVETVLAGNTPLTGCQNLAVNTVQRVQCPIPQTQYATQGIVFVAVQCVGCTSPRVNEIALEQKTRDVIGTVPAPIPTPTNTATFTPTFTPTPTVLTVVTSFAAQWSGNAVRLTWATTSENKIDTFQMDRATSISGPWLTAVVTQPSLSNCSAQTSPAAYSVFDNGAPTNQTIYYKLSWTGAACGGTGGTYSTMAMAVPSTDTPTVTNTPTTPPTPTYTNTATNTPTTPPTPTYTNTATNTPTTPPTPTYTNTATSTPTTPPTPTYTTTPTNTQNPPTATNTSTNTPTATPTACKVVPARPALLLPANTALVNMRVVQLDWTDVICATSYDAQVRQGSTTGTIVAQATSLASSRYTTSPLTPGKTYYWRVRARDAKGASSWTGYWHFKVSSTATTPAEALPAPDADNQWWFWLVPFALIGMWIAQRRM